MIAPSSPSPTTTNATGATNQNTKKISADFETFLKMLTVQMTNQDPLNPVDSADYAVQLATFSGVEQQVQTNDLLKALTAGLQADGLGSMASWIGKEVPATGPVHYTGTPVTIAPKFTAGVDQAVAEVRDANGALIDRFEVALDQARITWPTSQQDQATTPPGLYQIKLFTFKDGAPVAQMAAPTFQRVTEVRETPKGGLLVLQNGTTVAQSDVTALREGRGS